MLTLPQVIPNDGRKHTCLFIMPFLSIVISEYTGLPSKLSKPISLIRQSDNEVSFAQIALFGALPDRTSADFIMKI